MKQQSMNRWAIRTMTLLTGGIAVLLVGCAGAGFGSGVREDIEAQMSAAQPMLQSCYASALQRNRKAEGTMVVRVKTDPETGAFRRASVKSSDIDDPELNQCVLGTVARLSLEKPTETSVEADYPIEFVAIDGETASAAP